MTAENIKSQRFPVLKLTCAACAARTEKKLNETEGVNMASVNFATSEATISYDQSITTPERLRQSVQEAGYDLLISGKDGGEDLEKIQLKEYKSLKQRTILAIIISLPIAIIGMGFPDMPWSGHITWILSTPVIFWLGREFFINAWKQTRSGSANMDTLVALSISTAYFFSLFNLFFPSFWESRGLTADLYFETASVIVAFILIGRLLEGKAKNETSSAIRKLIGLQPKTVTILRDGEHIEVAIESVTEGDSVVVKPGERIAVDGVVTEGESYVDESMLSGEPIAVLKVNKEKVYAGTINQKGSFIFRADRVGEETLLAHIIKAVQDAQGSKAPVQQMVDRVARIFVPIVIGVAILSFFLWLLLGGDSGFTIGLMAFVTILVIACPCALGLATPTAIMVGVGKAAENGILIKDAESIERAKNITSIVLDKTGTITEGRPKVTDSHWLDEDNSSEWILYEMELLSEHPLAEAVVEFLRDHSTKKDKEASGRKLSNFQSITGKGASAEWDGERYIVGNHKLMTENRIEIDSSLQKHAEELSQQAKSVIWFANSKKTLAVLALGDSVKATSMLAIRSLQRSGMEVYMLTGDGESTANAIAKITGISNYKAEILPQQKADFIKELQAKGEVVAMVGDGINDSTALAQADISIAMGAGSDIAMDVAKMTIISSDLNKIPTAIKISRQTVTTIKQNLFWAFIYNIIGIPIAAGVLYPIFGFLLNPMIAGAAMALSSVCVVANSLRLRWKRI